MQGQLNESSRGRPWVGQLQSEGCPQGPKILRAGPLPATFETRYLDQIQIQRARSVPASPAIAPQPQLDPEQGFQQGAGILQVALETDHGVQVVRA